MSGRSAPAGTLFMRSDGPKQHDELQAALDRRNTRRSAAVKRR
jgi:hypothetical protein